MEVEELLDVLRLKDQYVCVQCKASGAGELRLLSSCEHLLCTPCMSAAASRCPKCAAAIKKRDSLADEGLQELLSGLIALNNAGDPSTDNCSTQIVPFFTHELTVNKLNHKGETRLHKECRDGKVDKVETLLQAGVDPNLQDFAGWTALHEAVAANKIDAAKLLLDYGAFVNTPGLNYDTPLHTALQEKNSALVELLMKYGAELTCCNKEGKTPIDLCNNSDDLRRILCLTQRRSRIYKVYTIPTPKVLCLDVSPDDVRKLSESADVTVCTEQNLLSANDVVTYVVVGNDDPPLKNLCAAMLQGSCVVTVKWVDDYLATRNVIPFNYVPDLPQFALSKAMWNAFNKLPRLFDGLHFYFLHGNAQTIGCNKFAVSDFKLLITLGGGKVLARKPSRLQEDELYCPYHAHKGTDAARTTHYLIYDDAKQDTVVQSRMTGIKYKSSKWLIECICAFAILA